MPAPSALPSFSTLALCAALSLHLPLWAQPSTASPTAATAATSAEAVRAAAVKAAEAKATARADSETPDSAKAAAKPEAKTQAKASAKGATPDAITVDGGAYFGPLLNGKMHGQGRIEWPSGQRYEGGFKDGMFSGHGRMQWPAGDVYEGAYELGMAQGKGNFRYSDGDTYTGEFKLDEMNGQGTLSMRSLGTIVGTFRNGKPEGRVELLTGEGVRIKGEMHDWEITGPGTVTLPDGMVIEGPIESWTINGKGSVRYPDGAHYQGDLVNGEPNGNGRLRYANGNVYRGEFIGGVPFGEGTMRYAKALPDGRRSIRGTWVDGKPLQSAEQAARSRRAGDADAKNKGKGTNAPSDAAPDTPAQWQANIDTVLYNQSALLARAFAQLKPQDPAQSDLYALLVGGDGTEEVFRREVNYVQNLLDTRYGTAGRSIALINSRTGVDKTPLATQHSLRASLQALARTMDPEQDVLLLFLTSHGSRTHDLSLQMRGLQLSDLPAQTLAQMLRESGIQRRIVIVSACYSGGFVEPLRDAQTLVITAARADRTSFGCADDRDFTYFGRALFEKALGEEKSPTLSAAFSRATTLVREWEGELAQSAGLTAQATEAAEAQTAEAAAAEAEAAKPGRPRLRRGASRAESIYSEPQFDGKTEWIEWLDAQWPRWQRGG